MSKLNRKPLKKSAAREPNRDALVAKHHPFCDSFSYCMVKSGMFLRALMEDAFSDSKLLPPQVAILTILIESGPMSQIEIGTVLSIDKATVVKLIDDLEKQGHVTRVADKVDRRIKRVQVSATGKKIKERAFTLRVKLEKEALSVLSTNERKLLADVLPKLLEHLREMNGNNTLDNQMKTKSS